MIPLGIILIPALFLVLATLVFGALTTWAMFRYGGDFSAFFGTALYWGASALIIGVAWSFLAPVDWFQPLFQSSTFFQTPF